MEYDVVIGLETHVQLKTKTKAFCSCSTEFGQVPNTSICPVCLGLPGSLPVLNKLALEFAVKTALALNCRIQRYFRFDRKNYFYPDLPKNYQISQYDLPVALQGFLEIEPQEGVRKCIEIKRIHLEEDAGKLIHTEGYSLIDFNRAGIPLLEIVSEPQINSPEEAYEYLLSLKEILRYLEVSDCDMEKGSLRCDANISLKKRDHFQLGAKIELKNMNSFKAVKDALAYEIERQSKLLDKGRILTQETRLWDAKEVRTVSMRTKESAPDYRYFPEPDLLPFVLEDSYIEKIKESLPELPYYKKHRFIETYGLSFNEARFIVSEKKLADYFELCVNLFPFPKIIYNWIVGPLMGELNERKISIEDINILPQDFVCLIKDVESDKINSLKAKEVLKKILDTAKSYAEVIKEESVIMISDSNILKGVVQKVLDENPKSVSDYKSGKTNALMFLVGQVMKKTQNNADPKIVQKLLKELLDGSV
ncbi:MAG: Asp-tRNA(Asn)/Glu-tRNA(Gln) amidotransferase subunit GatB [Candidatus Omnitrophica bacterium]|nr:Asp-tRNA(Asn)/Glu-tRNA(Gln) amidotransferase subunit GatB [Candidatus Omnitrophota bacterium]